MTAHPALLKFPRTPHLEGSRLQAGDEDLSQVRFEDLQGRSIVVREKIDGANAGLRFDAAGRLWLQSRGHFLTGGYRERHFDLFKQWASAMTFSLWPVLGSQFSLYGEWVYAKHTVYYDRLPHYFLAFAVQDTVCREFLSVERCRQLLAGTPVVLVPSLYEGPATTLDNLLAFLGRSAYKSDRWRENLREETLRWNLDVETAENETDVTDSMEGLYITVEEAGIVSARYKWVRHSFFQAVVDSETHWLRRPIIPNRLSENADLFGGTP